MVAKPSVAPDGDAYERYMGRWSRRVAPGFVSWAGLPAGGTMLDVGCGTGALTAALVDHGAVAVGLDNTPAFLAEAAKRLPDPAKAKFKAGNAETLSFADASFDAVASGLLVNQLTYPVKALQEMRRVARPGALVAAYVWDYSGKMELLRRFWDAATAEDPAAASLDVAAQFPNSKPAALLKLFREAGLQRVDVGHIDIKAAFASFDDYWNPFLLGQGPTPRYLLGLPEPKRAKLRDRIQAGMPANREGAFELALRAWTVRGTSPRRAFRGPRAR